jgi:outer membrane scaffolding protein for murein synthesis (MipA/OmpV family)
MRPDRLPLLLVLLCLPLAPWPAHADDAAATVAIGAGVQRVPRWAGARRERVDAVPFVDIELPREGLSLSTQDGLQLDLIRGRQLHGGLYGSFQWGRDHDDLGVLAGKLPTLAPRATSGGYLEWDFTRQLNLSAFLSHDLAGAGAYAELQAEWDPPMPGLVEQSLQLRWQAMNGAAMRRFFGIAPDAAQALGVPAWAPGAGSQQLALAWELFLPTSPHTGVAASLEYAHLLDDAAASPLVRRFGTSNQVSCSLAFVYHL